jgi:hypothetical protein
LTGTGSSFFHALNEATEGGPLERKEGGGGYFNCVASLSCVVSPLLIVSLKTFYAFFPGGFYFFMVARALIRNHCALLDQ